LWQNIELTGDKFMSLEFLGWFLFGSGISMVIIGICFWLKEFIQVSWTAKANHNLKGQESFINDKSNREISELNFRDKSGVLNTVRIIVDHDIEDDATPEDINNMSIDNLIHNYPCSEGSLEKIQQFIFSVQAVTGMRKHGLEPDEVVTKMLKASGRMA